MPATLENPSMVLTKASSRIIDSDQLAGLLKSNISCHAHKTLTMELIDTISTQIVESIDYFLNTRKENF